MGRGGGKSVFGPLKFVKNPRPECKKSAPPRSKRRDKRGGFNSKGSRSQYTTTVNKSIFNAQQPLCCFAHYQSFFSDCWKKKLSLARRGKLPSPFFYFAPKLAVSKMSEAKCRKSASVLCSAGKICSESVTKPNRIHKIVWMLNQPASYT